jgi:recombination protein RecA
MKKLTQEEKQKQLQATIDKLDKQFGKGSVMKLGDTDAMDVEVFSSGSLGLDIALGGGVPRGRIIEVYGPESSGKTTQTLHMIAEIQKLGGKAAFVDAEHAFDSIYARNLGVDTENLYICQPDYGEMGLSVVESLVKSGSMDIIVVDSVAALTPKAEIEGEMGDSKMGIHARLMGQAMRKITAAVSNSNCTVIFINQLREKIGVVFGSPEVTTGGNALKFYASVRLDIRRKQQIKDGTDIIGNHTVVKVVKNKVAPPFKKAEFDIMYGTGISLSGEVLDLGVEYGIINKAGSWFSYNGDKLGQGRETVKKVLEDNPELLEEIRRKVLYGDEEPTTTDE